MLDGDLIAFGQDPDDEAFFEMGGRKGGYPQCQGDP